MGLLGRCGIAAAPERCLRSAPKNDQQAGHLRRAHPPPVPSARTEKREGKHAGVHPRKWALVVLLGRCGTSASSAQRPRRTTSRVLPQQLTPCTPASPPPSRVPEDHNEARTGGRSAPREGSDAPASKNGAEASHFWKRSGGGREGGREGGGEAGVHGVSTGKASHVFGAGSSCALSSAVEDNAQAGPTPATYAGAHPTLSPPSSVPLGGRNGVFTA